MFTDSCHLFLPSATSIHSAPSRPISLRYILLQFSNLCLGLTLPLFHQIPYAPLLHYTNATCHSRLTVLGLTTRLLFDEENETCRSSLCSYSPVFCYLVPLRPKYLFQDTVAKHPQPVFFR